MSDRFIAVNLDTRQYIDPSTFGRTGALRDFGGAYAVGLALLLAEGGDGEGGVGGMWFGGRIAMARHGGDLHWQVTNDGWENLSQRVVEAMGGGQGGWTPGQGRTDTGRHGQW